MTPASRKKTNDAIRYMYPMVLWSVEVIHRTMMLPFRPTLDAWKSGVVGAVGWPTSDVVI
jgi:hypothetical protein